MRRSGSGSGPSGCVSVERAALLEKAANTSVESAIKQYMARTSSCAAAWK